MEFLPPKCASRKKYTCNREVIKFFHEFKTFLEKLSIDRQKYFERDRSKFGGNSVYQKMKEFNFHFGISVGQRNKDGLLVRFTFRDKV